MMNKLWISLILAITSCRSASAQSLTDLACKPLPNMPLCKFVDALEQPPVINGTSGKIIHIGAYAISLKLHRDLPPTPLYGFGTSAATATVPGPTIEARRNIATAIAWENHLNIPASKHLLPIDRTLMWANPRDGYIPIVPHLHGGVVVSVYDGHPDAWWTALGAKGKAFSTSTYTYPNVQEPGHSFYHDHTVGITRLNVIAGLAGLYVIRDPFGMESSISMKNLPSGAYEKFLMIQDRTFYANGSMNFPTVGVAPTVHPSWVPEYFGSAISVNNKLFPYLNVENTLYRFRIVEGSNARFYNLTLSSGQPFYVIASDTSYLARPERVLWLLLLPGERYDILVDFSLSWIGSEIILLNSANAPFPGVLNNGNIPIAVMKFIIKSQFTGKRPTLPTTLRPPIHIPTNKVSVSRNLKLSEETNANGAVLSTKLGGLRWIDPVTEKARKGSTEFWHIINLTEDAHAIHIHLVHFQIVSRKVFNVAAYKAGACTLPDAGGPPVGPTSPSCYTGAIEAIQPYEAGYKDTARVMPAQVTTFVVRFANTDGTPFSFDVSKGPGYVWHCHMLDHEDNDMMRPLMVTP